MSSLQICLSLSDQIRFDDTALQNKTCVADPDEFGPDPDQTYYKKTERDPTPENNADPDTDLCKILY
jgi:hypothetical protein